MKKTIILIAACFIPLTVSLAQSPDALLDQALKATEAGDFKKAIESYNKVLEQDSNNIAAYQGLGINYLLSGKYKESATALEKALALDANNTTTLTFLARLNEAQNKFDEAAKYYEKVAKVAPSSAEGHLGLGRLYNKSGQYTKAAETLEKAKTLHPKSRPISEELAFAYANASQYSKALTVEEELYKQYPSDKDIIIRIALLHEAMKSPKKAIPWYERAKKIDPADDRLMVRLAQLYSETQQIDAATTTLKQATQLQEGNISNYIALGRLYGWNAKLDEGIEILKKGEKMAPDNKLILTDLGYMLLYSGKWDEAEKRFNKVLKIEPGNKEVTDGLQEVKIQKNPQVVSRWNFKESKNYSVTGKHTKEFTKQVSHEYTHKFASNFNLEGRYQMDFVEQEVYQGVRDYKYRKDIGSAKFWSNLGDGKSMTGRLEFQHYDNEGANTYRFETEDAMGGYLFGVYDKKEYFMTASLSKEPQVTLLTEPARLELTPLWDWGLSYGYNIKKNLQMITRYDFLNYARSPDRHDGSVKLLWKVPGLEKLELNTLYERLTSDVNRTWSWGARYTDKAWADTFVDMTYDFLYINNVGDRDYVLKHSVGSFISVPLYKKLTANFDLKFDHETISDKDYTFRANTYLQVPFGIF